MSGTLIISSENLADSVSGIGAWRPAVGLHSEAIFDRNASCICTPLRNLCCRPMNEEEVWKNVNGGGGIRTHGAG